MRCPAPPCCDKYMPLTPHHMHVAYGQHMHPRSTLTTRITHHASRITHHASHVACESRRPRCPSRCGATTCKGTSHGSSSRCTCPRPITTSHSTTAARTAKRTLRTARKQAQLPRYITCGTHNALARARSLSLSLCVCVSRAAPCFSLCVCVAWLAFSLRADRDTQLRTTTTHFMFHSTLTGC